MTTSLLFFIIVACGLCAVATACLVLPLWNNHQSLNKGIALGLLVFLPLGSLGLYSVLGNTLLLTQPWRALPSNEATLVESVALARKRLQQDDHNVELMLAVARGEMLLDRYEEAIDLYRQALAIAGLVPQVVIPLAQSRISRNQGYIDDETVALLQQVRADYPGNVDAVWMLALAAEQNDDIAQAIALWESVLGLVADDNQSLAPKIEQQIARLSDPFTIDIAVTSQRALQPGEVLYISAHSIDPDGTVSSMPVAARRLPAAQLPLQIVLGNRHRIGGAPATLESYSSLAIRARISPDGAPEIGTAVTAIWQPSQSSAVQLLVP